MATRPELPIREIQADLAERGLDGWLLWDFRGQNPTAVAALDLSGHMLTRRWAYLVPREGDPVLLVCEEAHRFVPADEREGFSAAARALTRIAKEGRKYGISLGLISQHPSQLSADALSQCGTIIAMRMGNEVDQRFVERALPDAAQGMLTSLPMLRTREAIVSGEGVLLPMRIRFDRVPEEHLPRGDGVRFSEAWGVDSKGSREPGSDFVAEGVRRWRLQTRS